MVLLNALPRPWSLPLWTRQAALRPAVSQARVKVTSMRVVLKIAEMAGVESHAGGVWGAQSNHWAQRGTKKI
jgi:hypothetical protein